MRTTHTYVELELSLAAYNEIRAKLLAAGYRENFSIGDDGDGPIDMHGLAVIPDKGHLPADLEKVRVIVHRNLEPRTMHVPPDVFCLMKDHWDRGMSKDFPYVKGV